MGRVRLVRDQLIPHAKVAVVGESPGKEEVLSGQPFVGPSGALLNRFLFSAGLRRSDVAVLNVSLRRPSHNSDDINLIPKDELDIWKADLRRRLTLLPDVRLIVPLGNTALEAVLGTEKITLAKNKKLTISKARGFYFDNVILDDGRKVLVVPCFHPAATFREQTLVKVCEEFWEKIGEELRRGLVADVNSIGPLIDDTYTIDALPHPDDALDYAHQVIADGHPISFDIETPREVPRDKILCVGFSNDGKFGMTIPYDDHRAVGPKDWRVKYQEAIKLIVESELPKIGQNVSFDCYMLAYLKGINVRNVVYDTRTMDLVADPRRSHDLSSMVSRFLRARMWKCLPGNVEVLTPTGWVTLKDLPEEPELAAFNTTNAEIKWEKAKKLSYPALPRQGIRFRTQRHDCWYTVNHRVLLRGRNNANCFAEADGAPRYGALVIAGQTALGTRHDPLLLRIVAAVQADGYISRDNIHKHNVRFAFRRARKIARLTKLAAEAGCALHEPPRNKTRGSRDWEAYVSGARIDQAIELLAPQRTLVPAYDVSGAKKGRRFTSCAKLFGAWLLDFDAASLNAFVDELAYWDGWITNSGSKTPGKAINYSSKHKVNVEWAATAGHLTDRSANICQLRDNNRAGSVYWKVSLKDKPTCRYTPKQVIPETYDGPVYCVTVPSGAFVARSNGFVFVTGNSREEESRVNDNYQQLSEYCASDSLHTYHVAMKLKEILARENLFEVYRNIYGRRFYPLLRIMLHGTLVDQKTREELSEALLNECAAVRKELAEIAEVSLSGDEDKSLSDKKISAFLYGPKDPPARPIKLTKTGKEAKNQPPPLPKGLELKPILDKDTKKPTTNEVALRTLRLRVEGKNKRASHAIDLILRHREKHQLSTFVQANRIDKDDRFRCSFGYAETARLTSSSNPYGTGGNSQNVARPARHMFLPDPGCVFVQCDMSQIEDRIIKCYSKDPALIELARRKPWEYDAHTDLAQKIYGLEATTEPTHEQRDLGKRTRHGAQRDLKGQRFADELLKAGVVRTKAWCDEMLEAYHQAEPGIRNGYFAYIQELVMKYEELVTPWGYKVSFKGERKDSDLMREAYSTLPQAGAVLTVDLQGLCPLDELIRDEVLRTTRLNNEVHDSVIASCPLDEAFYVAKFLVTSLEQPVTYDGVELACPATVKVSATLGKDGYEWKQFPTKADFMREAEKMFEIAERRRFESKTFAVEWKKRVRQQAREEAKAKEEAFKRAEEEKLRLKAEKLAAKEAEKEAKRIERERVRAEKKAAKEKAKKAKSSRRTRRASDD